MAVQCVAVTFHESRHGHFLRKAFASARASARACATDLMIRPKCLWTKHTVIHTKHRRRLDYKSSAFLVWKFHSVQLVHISPKSVSSTLNSRVLPVRQKPTYLTMDSKKTKTEMYSTTQAPPADADSLDIKLEDLALCDHKPKRDVDSNKPSDRFVDSQRPAESAARGVDSRPPTAKLVDSNKPHLSTAKGVDSHKPFARFFGSQRSPSSTARGVDTQKPSSSTSRQHEHSRQPSARESSGRTTKGSITKLGFDMPPPYRTRVEEIRGVPSARQRQRSNTSNAERRSLYPEEKMSQLVPSFSPQQRSNSQKTTNLTLEPKSQTPTALYRPGDRTRTNLEGLVPKSQYEALYGASSRKYTYLATSRTPVRFMAPPTARSILVTPEGISMAARQTQYKSLAPSEQARQELWAQSKVKITGSCPEGFDWERIDDAYHCHGGHHLISDELLAEGKGGVYLLLDSRYTHDRLGPYYESSNLPGRFE
jgi:hypothetical protein